VKARSGGGGHANPNWPPGGPVGAHGRNRGHARRSVARWAPGCWSANPPTA